MLDSNSRTSVLEKLQSKHYDLIVIGGGITGAGIALDAASRGLNVSLVEMCDFASGTSSKSTKLIHGGLRYLKQLDFKLVHESGTERAIVHRIAPHLCIPQKMLLPITPSGSLGKFSSNIALGIYDFLAGVKDEDRKQMLSKEEAIRKEEILSQIINLKAAGFYTEYRTDDARLTIEILKKAASFGADILNYLKVVGFIYSESKIVGVKVQDMLSKAVFNIKSELVVSATGPWVDDIRSINDSIDKKSLHLTKGIHLVFAADRIGIKHPIYFDTQDGRMMFLIPRGNKIYAGTTDTSYYKDKSRIRVTKADRDYVLDNINRMFPKLKLKIEDVESNWAGLRPLIHEEGKSPSELSRKDETFVAEDGLISIAGGKLTGYRKMSERIVDLVIKTNRASKHSFKKCFTDEIALTLKPFRDFEDVRIFNQSIKEEIKSIGLTKDDAFYLVHNYGRQARVILSSIDSTLTDIHWALLKSELNFCFNYEMVVKPEDFLIRRTGRMYFNIGSVLKYKSSILEEFKKYFDWNDLKLQEEQQALGAIIELQLNYFDEE